MIKPLLIGWVSTSIILGGAALYYRAQYRSAHEALIDAKAKIQSIREKLLAAEERAVAAEKAAEAEIANMTRAHNARLKELEVMYDRRIAALRGQLASKLEELRQCRIDPAIVRVLNDPVLSVPAPGNETPGTPAPSGGTTSTDSAAVTCADVIEWANAVRDAKERNDQQLIDLQKFYEHIRSMNNKLLDP